MLITYSNNNAVDIKPNKEIFDVEIEEEDTNEILNVEKIKLNGENVFFVETHNTTEHKLSTRQACSIESAGMFKEHITIYRSYFYYLLFTLFRHNFNENKLLSFFLIFQHMKSY